MIHGEAGEKGGDGLPPSKRARLGERAATVAMNGRYQSTEFQEKIKASWRYVVVMGVSASTVLT